jgi:hypothetical protein
MMGRRTRIKRLEGEMEAQKRVNFRLSAPEAQNVLLAGDFNGWDVHSHPLKKDSKGTWEISIELKPGRYEYRFIVDGVWQNDPKCDTFSPNPLGSENCVLTLKMNAINKEKKFNLDEIILKIVREMQPISSIEVLLEVGENVDVESKPSQINVNQILEKMEKENILKRIRLKNKEEKYISVEKSLFDKNKPSIERRYDTQRQF